MRARMMCVAVIGGAMAGRSVVCDIKIDLQIKNNTRRDALGSAISSDWATGTNSCQIGRAMSLLYCARAAEWV